ncbi:MAG: DNA cytosine methyltransferase [Alphaproteobacteria bacterium]|jgi:DNA (cytosine-5)-methyltransferase 1|nr:DNA cytosine methyltransferase [Alphaproteobacteria bacterium]
MINGISLFSNVGIGETYFEECGINICIANELISERAKFYQHLYPNKKIICGNFTDTKVQEQLVQEYKKFNCDFLIATPPCQGMSSAGKRDSNDKRNLLIIDTILFIKKTKPKYILIENVPQILKTSIYYNNKEILIPDFIKEELQPLGYNIQYKVLDSADYNTPQYRKRAIFLITKEKKLWDFPFPQNHITVAQAIGDLPSIEAGDESNIQNHFSKPHAKRQIEWMKHTPTGKTALDNEVHFPSKNGRKIKGYRTTYKRIDWHKPAPTITMANGSISSQNNVHPGKKLEDGTYSDARVLTLLELFRLTGLPDNWNIPNWASENLVRKVIGESFPPRFSQAIVSMLKIKNHEK